MRPLLAGMLAALSFADAPVSTKGNDQPAPKRNRMRVKPKDVKTFAIGTRVRAGGYLGTVTSKPTGYWGDIQITMDSGVTFWINPSKCVEVSE